MADTLRALQNEIERRSGKSLVDLVRTRYWASFSTVEALAEQLGCGRHELIQLMECHRWELQTPPALLHQNGAVPWPPVAGATTVTDFVRNQNGDPSGVTTHATVQPCAESVHIVVECHEPCMGDIKQAAGTTEKESDPFNVGVWEAHFGEWEGQYQWWTEQFRQAAAVRAFDALLERARAIGPRPYSLFEDDCVIVALTPVDIGEDTNPLDATRFDPDPWALARELRQGGGSRIYQTGTYHLVAVNPRGVWQETYHDSWEDGFFWPSWRSGGEVQAELATDSWRVELTIPFRNLEPLMDNGAVWGVDLYRHRPGSAEREAEYARSRKTVFFRYEGESVALKHWRITFEDTERHAWTRAVVPHVLETVERPTPETAAAALPSDIANGDWPSKSDWTRSAAVQQFCDDRTGATARAETAVQLLFDTRRLYVRFQCREDCADPIPVVTPEQEEAAYPGHLRANFLHRRCKFGIGWGDFVEVMLVPGLKGADCHHAGFYDLLINSQGTHLETYHDPFGMMSLREEDAWHADAQVSTDVGNGEWTVCIAIPFESFHGVRSAGDVWHLNLRRMRAARHDGDWREFSAWMPSYGWPLNRGDGESMKPERYGRLALPDADFVGLGSGSDLPLVFEGRTDDATVLPSERDRSRDPLRGVCFVDARFGWAVGGLGTILHTGDGGATWEEQASGTGYALERVRFVNRNHGWATGGWVRDKGVAVSGGMGIILATSDGGRSWRTVWEGRGPWLHDIFFVDECAGWACGENGTVLKTVDGGTTWTHLAATGTMESLNGICFADREHGWAVGGREAILVTRDGGTTWARARGPVLPRPLGMRATLNAVYAHDRARCWAVGTEGTLLRSTDGGETWELQNLGLDPDAAGAFDLTDVWFADGNTGWAVGEIGSAIFRTEDGGRAWEAVPTAHDGALSGLRFLDARTGWAVGERASRLSTTDGGRSWHVASTAPAKPGLMYITAHDHHLNGVAGALASLGVDHELTCVFSSGGDACRAASWCLGGWQARTWSPFIGGRRRAPGRLHHHYQIKRGLEPLERRLAAAIRFLKPETVICEWPIMDEGYWAGEPAFVARAAARAFESAADPAQFPELAELGLVPHQASRLYHLSLFYNDLYRVHPANVTVTPEDRYCDTLGMTASEAAFHQSCCWRGLLDRGSGRRAVGSLNLHLKREAER